MENKANIIIHMFQKKKMPHHFVKLIDTAAYVWESYPANSNLRCDDTCLNSRPTHPGPKCFCWESTKLCQQQLNLEKLDYFVLFFSVTLLVRSLTHICLFSFVKAMTSDDFHIIDLNNESPDAASTWIHVRESKQTRRYMDILLHRDVDLFKFTTYRLTNLIKCLFVTSRRWTGTDFRNF